MLMKRHICIWYLEEAICIATTYYYNCLNGCNAMYFWLEAFEYKYTFCSVLGVPVRAGMFSKRNGDADNLSLITRVKTL